MGSLILLATMLLESAAHIAMLYPMPRGGYGTKEFNWRIHTFVGYEKFTYPCGGYKQGPNTNLKAGQLIPVRFWASGMRETDRLPKKKISAARHGGGMCEFSLSNDGGKSFHVIATYTMTCPDVNYEWPVRIPDNVPSCNTPGTIRLAIARVNCADVTVEGTEDGSLPETTIQLYNFGNHPKKSFPGDHLTKGHGPLPNEAKVASSRKSL
ncbi:hypothetical protein BGX24_012289 [Mortierella sp. AD032]|nr:hypothetical protein BGX24_012289 [Mortierella sp. AD032]